MSEIDETRAKLSALEKTRGTQMGTVRIKHDAVGTALTAASNNDPNAAKAWTGQTKVRTSPRRSRRRPARRSIPASTASGGTRAA